MKVIVAGLPKTGTKSMNAALSMLGYEVYDVVENVLYFEKEWDDVFTRGFTTETFYRMYKDIDATVGLPACSFWEEIHRAFPEAKIILTVRDSEEQWVKSLKSQMRMADTFLFLRILLIVADIVGRKVENVRAKSIMLALNVTRGAWRLKTNVNDSISMMKYRAHNAYVMKNAPEDKLLVFNCKDGWKPLCNFLDQPIPDCPFPHENIGACITRRTVRENVVVNKFKRELAMDCVKFLAKLGLLSVIIVVFANIVTKLYV